MSKKKSGNTLIWVGGGIVALYLLMPKEIKERLPGGGGGIISQGKETIERFFNTISGGIAPGGDILPSGETIVKFITDWIPGTSPDETLASGTSPETLPPGTLPPGTLPPGTLPPDEGGGNWFPDIPSVPDGSGKANTVADIIGRSLGLGGRQLGGAFLTGSRLPLVKPIPGFRLVKQAGAPLRQALVRTAAKAAPKIGVKVGARAIPVLGWGLLAVDVAADIARLFGADVTEWLGISGVAEPFLGYNPIERWVQENRAPIETEGASARLTPLDISMTLALREATSGAQPEQPTKSEAEYNRTSPGVSIEATGIVVAPAPAPAPAQYGGFVSTEKAAAATGAAIGEYVGW